MRAVGNGTVLTLDDQMNLISNGCVVMENDRIVAVGDNATLRAQHPQAEYIDAQGKCILPGFINVHHHIYSAFARGMALSGPAPTNFLDVLQRLWWQLDNALTLEDVTYSAYVVLLDCIRNGVTTVFDHHASPMAAEGSLFAVGEVVKELGLRASLSLEISDRNGEGIANALVNENIAWLATCRQRNDDQLKGLLGLHASFTLGDKTLARIAEQMYSEDGYHIHVAEGSFDAKNAMDTYQMQVLDRLDRFGILRKNTLAVHCISIPDEGFDLLKTRDTCVVHNPQSNMNNGVGCARVLDMHSKGILVGLGTDGYTSDMLESYKTAPILQRHAAQNPGVGFLETADMFLRGNAAIASRSFARPLGVLKEGAYADVVVMDYDPPTPLTQDNQIGHILFGFAGRMVDTTIASGCVLMQNRQMQCVDAPAIYAKAREVAKALWARL